MRNLAAKSNDVGPESRARRVEHAFCFSIATFTSDRSESG